MAGRSGPQDREDAVSIAVQTPFTAPVVERLSIRVVVDSHYERFLPRAEHEHVTIEHVGQIPGRPMTTLAGEWGLALHLESRAGGANAQYMLDFGFTAGNHQPQHFAAGHRPRQVWTG